MLFHAQARDWRQGAYDGQRPDHIPQVNGANRSYQGPEIDVGSVHSLMLGDTGSKRATTPHSRTPPMVAQAALGVLPRRRLRFGDLDTHDAPCRFLCKHAGVHVLAIDYRLSPEAPFPTAVNDALEGYRFAVEHAAQLGADSSRIGVSGDSAGGNLSAVIAQLTRGERPPDFAVLIYPATDRSRAYRSQSLFKEGFLLTMETIAFFDAQYFGNDPEIRRDPKLSPLLCANLSGLCPSVVITAGFDPLRDEGAAYAEALQQAGNEVTLRCERELVHGFINMIGTSRACEEAMLRIADDTRRLARG